MSVYPIGISHRVFHDIDELEATCRETGHRDVNLTQLSLERFQSEFILIDFGEALVMFFQPHGPVQCFGSKVDGYLDFSYVLDWHKAPMMIHGHHVAHETFYGLDPYREMDMVVPPNQVHFCLQVKRQLAEDCAEALDHEGLDDHYLRNNFAHAPETLPQVADYIRELFSVVHQRPEFLAQPDCKTLILEDLMPLVIAALPSQQTSTQGLTPLSRTNLIKEARACINEHLAEPLTVKTLVENLHTSKRTLFYAFEEAFGIGPMTYLKVQRLRAVRQRLKAVEPGDSNVTQVAQKFGFWSLGHFSRDYKTMFGESPRETLRQAAKRTL